MVYELEIPGGKRMSFELGRYAKQASGSVMVRQGDTMVLVTAVAAEQPKEGIDFMPLQVEFRERTAAAGKIPGGYFKREARPSEKEILSARLVDRPIRPMFPKNWRTETQIVAFVVCSDQEHDADVLAATGASLALLISDIPFAEPIAEVRVARVAGEIVINPTFTQLKEADYEFTVAGPKGAIVMVEGEGKEIDEADMVEALRVAAKAIDVICDEQLRIQGMFEKSMKKRDIVIPELDEALAKSVAELATADLRRLASTVLTKEERSEQTKSVKEKVKAALLEKLGEENYPKVAGFISSQLHDIEKHEMRVTILDSDLRLDGRNSKQVRPITCDVGILPRVHGSALFTRGETQSLTTATLGTKSDEQYIEGLQPETKKRFMLHYNFPPFSVGEVGRMTGTGRREIGHGNLAERALRVLMPDDKEFPYTVRIVSDILESNGSSSMATVCAGTLALYDAGVPLKKPVAGIAMGLIKEGDRVAILSDILGNEDHLGDMDFKVTGTKDGITACQMDMKIKGISFEVMEKALMQAKEGRLHILDKMNAALDQPREELSMYAPRLTTIQVPVESIGMIIGPGGKMIRGIQAETGAEISIEDDGTLTIAAVDGNAAKKAKDIIEGLLKEPEEGATYSGRVTQVREGLGAIVEFLPKKEGLLHISEVDYQRVENISDIIQVGDVFDVKLIAVKGDGKFSLSRRALLEKPEGWEERPRRDDRGGDRRGGGGGRFGDRDRGGDRRGGGGGRFGDRDRRDDRGPRDDRPREDRGDRGGPSRGSDRDDRRRDDRPRDDRPREDRGPREDRPRDDHGGERSGDRPERAPAENGERY
jgi:polyribonucleotide nucleotidyltransferase